MAAFKVDGTFTTAAVQRGPRRLFPIERDTTAQIIEQDYIQLLANFARLPLNTPHPSESGFYLVGESDLQNLGAGLVQWTRRYANIPATRNEYESFAYTFPGFDNWSGGYVREPIPARVTSRIQYDYYLVGSGSVYLTPDDIPTISRTRYVATAWGLYYDVQLLTYATTSPTRSAYEVWIADGTEIVAEDADIHAWQGNIYERVTRYVVAQ